ncbi:hypothetical protein [Paenirhodobacter enshiensis]|uniref:hypothetical protein n=1 Tax=Paenirhodobacter enshiensis TaxID=1105367 RepID=UPI003FA24D5C
MGEGVTGEASRGDDAQRDQLGVQQARRADATAERDHLGRQRGDGHRRHRLPAECEGDKSGRAPGLGARRAEHCQTVAERQRAEPEPRPESHPPDPARRQRRERRGQPQRQHHEHDG